MKRVVAGVLVLIVGLCVSIGLKLRAQAQELRGPAGGSGVLEGTDLNVSSRISARVLTASVRRGDRVHAGQVLFTLDCAEPQAAVAEAEARVASARAQADAAVAAESAARNATLAARAQTSAARSQAQALAVQRDEADRNAQRAEQLGETITETSREQSVASAQGLSYQVRAARASSAAVSQQARVTRAQADAAHAQAEAARRSIAAADAALARARLTLAECEVRAPRDAVVDEVYYEVGELPAPGAALARLVDTGDIRATFYLPNGELRAARPGAHAVVEADAYPGEKFQGAVSTVSVEAEFTPRNIQTRTDRDRLVYAVEVRLPNADGRLRPGMPVQVTLPGTGQ